MYLRMCKVAASEMPRLTRASVFMKKRRENTMKTVDLCVGEVSLRVMGDGLCAAGS